MLAVLAVGAWLVVKVAFAAFLVWLMFRVKAGPSLRAMAWHTIRYESISPHRCNPVMRKAA